MHSPLYAIIAATHGLDLSTRLGPYEIQSPLGAGGTGEVYRAMDTRLDRIVAVKIIPMRMQADPDLKARFDREARSRRISRIARKLSRPAGRREPRHPA